MQIAYHPQFGDDLNDVVTYIETQAPGFTSDLIDSVETEILRLRHTPYLWRVYRGNVRRIWVKRFRYGIYYAYYPEKDLIQIYALSHLSRDESAWSNRV